MKKLLYAFCAVLFLSSANADILLSAGESHSMDLSDIDMWVIWSSPDYPHYNHYSFTLQFSEDLYDENTDDLRIRLYEDSEDTTPFLTLFEPGTIAWNLSVDPTYIKESNLGGSYWHDYTGRIEVEVISGSVQLDHLSVHFGPSGGAYHGQMDVVPEPSSFALLALSSVFVWKSRKFVRGRR